MNRPFYILILLSFFAVSAQAQNFAVGSGQDNNQAAYPVYGQQQGYPVSNYQQPYGYPAQAATLPGQPTQGMGQPLVIQPIMVQPVQMQQGDLIDTNTSAYTLGPGDVIEILVTRHPEVSGTYVVNQEGVIQYEFVGDVVVQGLNKNEVREQLIQRLSEYIISPDITVKISGYNSKVVFVIGEVGRPGKLIMRGDTITVHEAIMQAGLPLSSGKINKAVLITPDEQGNATRKPVNLNKLLYKGDMRENLVMYPGDTLYIPPTFLTKTMRAMSPVAAPISTAAGTTRNVQGF